MRAAFNATLLGIAFICSGATPAGAAPKVFEVTASAANLVGNDLILDDPTLNNKPGANLVVTQNYTLTGEYNKTYTTGSAETFLDHPVGVGYDSSLKRWYIYIEDNIPIPVGATFNVLVGACATVYATPLNSEDTETFFALEKGEPSALLFITHLLNPNRTFPDGNGIIVKHDTGVGYDSTASDGLSAYKHWYIGTEDLSVAEAAAYFVFNGTAYANQKHVNAFTVTSPDATNTVPIVTGNSGGDPIVAEVTPVGGTVLDNPLINGNANAVIFVTHVLSNGDTFNNIVGVYYDGSNWNLINPNVNANSGGFSAETFNVLAFDAPTP